MSQLEDRTYVIIERLEEREGVVDPPEVQAVPNETGGPAENSDHLRNTLILVSISVLFGIYWFVLTRTF